jgi:hypothetical protein
VLSAETRTERLHGSWSGGVAREAKQPGKQCFVLSQSGHSDCPLSGVVGQPRKGISTASTVLGRLDKENAFLWATHISAYLQLSRWFPWAQNDATYWDGLQSLTLSMESVLPITVFGPLNIIFRFIEQSFFSEDSSHSSGSQWPLGLRHENWKPPESSINGSQWLNTLQTIL